MMDSCSDSKVEPGLAARYSMFKVLSTSTMKSDPGRSITRAVALGATAPFSRASRSPGGVDAPGRAASAACCDFPICGFATRAAAPAAAPLRNPRRLVDLAIARMLLDEVMEPRVGPSY